jgi:hypothetical protein
MTRSEDMINWHNHTFEDHNGCQALQEKSFFLGICPGNSPILSHVTMTVVCQAFATMAMQSTVFWDVKQKALFTSYVSVKWEEFSDKTFSGAFERRNYNTSKNSAENSSAAIITVI